MRRYVSALIGSTIPQGQTGDRDPVPAVGAENRVLDDTSKKDDVEVVGRGGNNKVKQYKNTIPQKKETVHRFYNCSLLQT